MQQKRTDKMADMRRQRLRIRRASVGVLVVLGVFALVSCEGLMQRGGLSQAPAATSVPLNAPLDGGAAAERRS